MDENEKNSIINFDEEAKNQVSYATSKGNLPKWRIDNTWYKTDAFGYESLAECIISDLLKYSNINSYVKYDIMKGIYDGVIKNFSVSESFINDEDVLLTFYRLYFLETGNELTKDVLNIQDIKERIKYVSDFISKHYELDKVGEIITSILELDLFFLNEDRHFNNFALIRRGQSKQFEFAPVFDNGLSLLSDIDEYKMEVDIYKNIDKVKGKPFSISLEEQCEKAESLYGTVLKFKFTKNDVLNEIYKYKSFYNEAIIERVISILFEQMRKYYYLFENV